MILEPGSAFTWRTGYLVSTVEDIVENGGVRTAMLDVSFACHMPDCLEMPYKPAILGARDPEPGEKGWRMGGNSCLAGDYYGDWIFDRDLRVGDRIVFEDMIHFGQRAEIRVRKERRHELVRLAALDAARAVGDDVLMLERHAPDSARPRRSA